MSTDIGQMTSHTYWVTIRQIVGHSLALIAGHGLGLLVAMALRVRG